MAPAVIAAMAAKSLAERPAVAARPSRAAAMGVDAGEAVLPFCAAASAAAAGAGMVWASEEAMGEPCAPGIIIMPGIIMDMAEFCMPDA
jgi:hypothetical protein